MDCFEADWARQLFTRANTSSLVWLSRSRRARFANSVTKRGIQLLATETVSGCVITSD